MLQQRHNGLSGRVWQTTHVIKVNFGKALQRLEIKSVLQCEAALIRGIDEKENFSQSENMSTSVKDVSEMITNIISWKVEEVFFF